MTKSSTTPPTVPVITQLTGILGQFGQSGPEPSDIQGFVQQHPSLQTFFAKGGAYSDFARELQAFASGKGFLMGAAFGVVATPRLAGEVRTELRSFLRDPFREPG